ncbi:hypothetical protein Tco_0990529 [Tanacetum coccineum]|uniref:Integrase, catalytic region, zinc finger, CCHC-type, peptidase aspartic, catalytic n=1 Tax=Tanacetum coccineum TaxID=301880 RepID=A0ABQ5EX05_9ASTR
MTTLAEHIIVAGAENRPPMLEKSMYDSWASRIHLFIKGKKHGRMMLDSIDNSPLVYPTVEENGQTRPMKYSELSEAQQLQDDLLLEILSHLINDMHTIRMTMQQVQVNTKFLNALSSEWSKFVTDVKLAKSLYTTNYDQLYSYLNQHERHANEVHITRERYSNPLAFVANSPTLYNPSQSPQHSVNPQQHPISPPPFISPSMTQQSQAEFPKLDSGLTVSMFQQGEDPIECINKAMAFPSAVASRLPLSNNQLKTSSDPRNQATIQDGRVTFQQVQGRQNQSYAGTRNRRITTTLKRNVAAGPPREKLMLAEAQEAGQILDEEQLVFLADPDCDDLSLAKAVLMANLSSCDPEVLSESQDALIKDTNPSAPNDLLMLSLVEQMTDHVAHLDKENQTNKMEIDTLKKTLSNNVKEKESLSKTLTVFKTESKEKESKYIDKEIVLEKPNKELENTICKMYRSTQAMHMSLILEEESRSKMLDKQNDPISIEKKIEISLIDYSKLNMIKEDFGKRFVTQKELSAKQAFWLKYSSLSETPIMSHTPVRIEAPSELPKDAVDQCSVDKNVFEIQIKQLRIDNDQLLNQIMSQEIVHIVANYVDILDVKMSCVNNCNKCLELKIELFKKNEFIEKEAYDRLVKSFSNLEKHCISLELATQLTGENLNAPTFNQLFEINELKAQSQEKDTGVKPTTSASGSKPSGNTKKIRIMRPPCSNQKNKVEY